MLLVLPPSRGQTPGPADAPPLDLATLAFADALTAPRAELIAALAGTPSSPAGQPAAPAADVFTGVLFAAAALPELLRRRAGNAARERATRDVLIASPLLGVVSPADRIPASRLALGPVPGIGALGAFWRPHLDRALEARAAACGVVVDLRSSEFLPLWRPPTDTAWVSTRVVQEGPGGERRVVSHFAKHWRGVLGHHLLTRRGAAPTTARGLVRAVRGLVTSGAIAAVEYDDAPRPGSPATLTLVVP